MEGEVRQERERGPHRMCYQVCCRLGYWNTILLRNSRRQCGAQASGLASLHEGVGVFTHQLLSVCWLKAAGGEQRMLNSPALLAALRFSRANSGGRQSPQAELQEVRLGWQGRHRGRYWQHRLTHVTQTVSFHTGCWTDHSGWVPPQGLWSCSYFFFCFLFLLRAKFLTGVVYNHFSTPSDTVLCSTHL